MQQNFRTKEYFEIAGIVAVLIGLIFVGFELRQNTSSVQAAFSQGILEQSNQLNVELASNGVLANLVAQGDADLANLSGSERLRYQKYMMARFNIREQGYYGYLAGTFSERIWRGYDQGFGVFFCQPSTQSIWIEVERGFGTEFRNYVNRDLQSRCKELGR